MATIFGFSKNLIDLSQSFALRNQSSHVGNLGIKSPLRASDSIFLVRTRRIDENKERIEESPIIINATQ